MESKIITFFFGNHRKLIKCSWPSTNYLYSRIAKIIYSVYTAVNFNIIYIKHILSSYTI
jgi:hypothetical protein